MDIRGGTVLQIKPEHTRYAFDECLKVGKSDFGKLAWEKELLSHSPEFCNSLFRHIEISDLHRAEDAIEIQEEGLRKALAYPFATVYAALGKKLPPYLAHVFEREFRTGVVDFDQDIQHPMDELSVDWRLTWFTMLQGVTRGDRALTPVSMRVMYVAIKMLLADALGKPLTETTAIAHRKSNGDSAKITFRDIVGLRNEKKMLREIIAQIKDPKTFLSGGLDKPIKGVIFAGEKGNGKTMLAKAVATEAGVAFFELSAKNFSSYINQSAKAMEKMFDDAQKDGGVIFIDEADSMLSSRGRVHSHQEDEKVLAAYNRRVDGFKPNDRVLVILATNRIDNIDEAAIRSGRIDRIFKIENPNEHDRRMLLVRYCRRARKISKTHGGKGLFKDLDFCKLAKVTNGLNRADIANVVDRALREIVRLKIAGDRPHRVDMDDFLKAIREHKKERDTSGKKGYEFKFSLTDSDK